MKIPSQRLVVIDLLRFFAALSVAFYHLGYWSWAPERSSAKEILQGAAAYPELRDFTSWGWVGVQIFFVISGYVIAFSASRSDVWRFLESRFLRLWPAAFLCATITASVMIINGVGINITLLAYIKSIGFWPMYGWVDGAYWTLWIEISFYCIVLCLLALNRPHLIETTMIAVGSISMFFWLLQTLSPMGLSESPDLLGMGNRWAQIFLVQHGMYFALGVVIQAGHKHEWNRYRLLFATLFFLGGFWPIFAKVIADNRLTGFAGSAITPTFIYLTALALVFYAPQIDKILARMPTAMLNLIAVLGLATYPLYLLHTVVGTSLLRILIESNIDKHFALAISIFAMCLLAIFVTLWFEAPLRSGLKSVIRFKSTAHRMT